MPFVACVFRRPVFYTDSLVALCAGPLVHVEIMPIDSREPRASASYTSYVGCPFALSLSTKQTYDNTTCAALVLQLSDVEHEALLVYLQDLCEAQIPYNYRDTALLMLPGGAALFGATDVPSEVPRALQSLFCSQAVVLALRNALDARRPLTRVLAGLNSRTVLPYALFTVLHPYARGACCAALAEGRLAPLRPPRESAAESAA
jgi:hypothetical protein